MSNGTIPPNLKIQEKNLNHVSRIFSNVKSNPNETQPSKFIESNS